jgi:hypothetical protein
MAAPRGNTNAKGRRWKPILPKAPWPLRSLDHRGWGGATMGGYTHGGTVAHEDLAALPRHADGDADAPPLRELVTPVMPPAVAEVFHSLYKDIAADLGGEENLSAMAKILVRSTAHTALQLAYVDAWIASRPEIINNVRHQLIPVVLQRQRLAKTLAQQLNVLGLERRARNVDTLESYLARRDAAVSVAPRPSTAATTTDAQEEDA